MMHKNTLITIIVLAIILIGGGYFAFSGRANDNMNNADISPQEYSNKIARVQTNMGEFVISFYDNDAPLAVENFIRLSQDGKYEGTPFHRVMSGFMVQTGDYNGLGGGSIWGQPFRDELNPASPSYQAGYTRGTVAMANAGPNTNGSQFFIMHADYPLPNLYTIFGQVIEGMDTIDKIASVNVVQNPYSQFVELSLPTESVIIEKITIENK
jgi:cyclophilin family peptidyl-prolyl cis-trans isomerase